MPFYSTSNGYNKDFYSTSNGYKYPFTLRVTGINSLLLYE